MSKPVAVIIGDIHFTVSTLDLAYKSLSHALRTAKRLGVKIIINGDTVDAKAALRAEVVNSLISVFRCTDMHHDDIIVNVGNHDLLNEKGEGNALEFLYPYVILIRRPSQINTASYIVPYQTDPNKLKEYLKEYLKEIPKNSTLFLHQGVQTAYLGHYAQDNTSLPSESFDGYRVIASHYHRRQDINCGESGLFSYIGNPYTLTFGEASDGPKGYAVLMQDGTLEHIPLGLRKHIIIETDVNNLDIPKVQAQDLIWLKLRGATKDLRAVNKAELGARLFGHSNFKLTFEPIDNQVVTVTNIKATPFELLDALIDTTSTSKEDKVFLKQAARELLNETTESNS